VQTGSAGKLSSLQAPREFYGEDGQEQREPEMEETVHDANYFPVQNTGD
jgi:hypothetical protein